VSFLPPPQVDQLPPEHTHGGEQYPLAQQPDLQSELTVQASAQPQVSPPQLASVATWPGSHVTLLPVVPPVVVPLVLVPVVPPVVVLPVVLVLPH
jgi:hypothetical protein